MVFINIRPDDFNPPEPEPYIEPEDDYDEHRDYQEFLREERENKEEE